MYYNFAILLLFGLFIPFRFVNSNIVPLQLCLQAADTISSLLSSYGQLYSLRQTLYFIPILALASSMIYAVQAKTQGTPTRQLLLGMSTLQEMAYSHGFAERRVNYLRLTEQHIISVPNMPSEGISGTGKASPYQQFRYSICFIEAGIEDPPLDQADPSQTSIFAPFSSQMLPYSSYPIELRAYGLELVEI